MKKIIYLTYAEAPSGVYSSQVVDVISFLNSSFSAKIQLVAFISLHDYSNQKKSIKNLLPDAIVLPMLPKATYWRLNVFSLFILCLFLRPSGIIARNVMATNMALKVRNAGMVSKVCLDGRGAIAAEWKEYDVSVVDSWKKEIDVLEKNAVLESDFRIAVSEKLVEYWNTFYGYKETNHVVIPCTLNSNFNLKVPGVTDIAAAREKLKVEKNCTLLAYSGSTAGWQSFSILHTFLSRYLKTSPDNKVLFLSAKEENISKLTAEFPGQVMRLWVPHKDVTAILTACDYGILIREQTITNKVASPTKFAEYLSAGLPVLITENLGDYSGFVREHHCGFIIDENELLLLEQTSTEKRSKIIELVKKYCTKEAYLHQYGKLINSLTE